MFIDTHCHLDAPETAPRAAAIRQAARDVGVAHCVYPSVMPHNFDTVRRLAHELGDSYNLGIHPLYVANCPPDALQQLELQIQAHHADPRLVAVGEIGLDYFVPQLKTPPLADLQWQFYIAQLRLAKRFDLPVVLHVRRSADKLLKGLRQIGGIHSGMGSHAHRWRGIAPAFNGSMEQAHAFIDMGFKLGFGGAVTFDGANQLRRLATDLPLDSIVLETDTPDIPPQWLYVTAADRASGVEPQPNTPQELPRIAEVIADLRGIPVEQLAESVWNNTMQALPRLAGVGLKQASFKK